MTLLAYRGAYLPAGPVPTIPGIEWFDGVTIIAEAALFAASGDYALFDVGKFDTALFGLDVVWADVSADLRSFNSSRRFSRSVSAWQAGTATFVLNNRHRYYSPSNLSPDSPFVSGGISQIRPLRPMRLRVTFGGVTYHLYTGYSMAWEETYVAGHADAYVTVPCEDELSQLGMVDGVEQTPVGAGETSGRRIHRVLDNAGYTGPRSVELGQVTLQETTLAANTVTELKLVADSEGGSLFVDADGTVVFEQQYALLENARSNTVQAVFGDGSGDPAVELPCADIQLEFNGELLCNVASFARKGGAAQVVSDPSSRQIYRDRRESRTDLLCETDTQVRGLAEWHVEQYKQPEQRVTRVVIKPRKDPARLFPQVLGRRVRDLVRVVVRPLGGGVIVHDAHIAGISHNVTKDDWTTTFELSSATVHQRYATSRFDVGVFDTATAFFGSGTGGS